MFGLCQILSLPLFKVVGSVRTQGEKKHVMAFKISAVSCKAEWDAHLLQVTKTVWVDLDNMKRFRWFTPS